jgi:hypothetical protein
VLLLSSVATAPPAPLVFPVTVAWNSARLPLLSIAPPRAPALLSRTIMS